MNGMRKFIRQEWKTLLFVAAIIVAAGFHLLEHAGFGATLTTLFFCISSGIYAGLVIVWIQTVWIRLLPNRNRRYFIAAGIMFLFLIAIRIIRYRIVTDNDMLQRICWYSMYITTLYVPTLFLMICVFFYRGWQRTKFYEEIIFLLIPTVFIIGGRQKRRKYMKKKKRFFIIRFLLNIRLKNLNYMSKK